MRLTHTISERVVADVPTSPRLRPRVATRPRSVRISSENSGSSRGGEADQHLRQVADQVAEAVRTELSVVPT